MIKLKDILDKNILHECIVIAKQYGDDMILGKNSKVGLKLGAKLALH